MVFYLVKLRAWMLMVDGILTAAAVFVQQAAPVDATSVNLQAATQPRPVHHDLPEGPPVRYASQKIFAATTSNSGWIQTGYLGNLARDAVSRRDT